MQTLILTLYRLRGAADSPQKRGTTAQTPRTNANPSCLRSALPVHLQERHSNPQIAPKAAASQLANHLRNRRPKGVQSVSGTCQSATVTTQTTLATGIAVGLGRKHISVIKPLYMFWACVNLEYQTESAPLIQCAPAAHTGVQYSFNSNINLF